MNYVALRFYLVVGDSTERMRAVGESEDWILKRNTLVYTIDERQQLELNQDPQADAECHSSWWHCTMWADRAAAKQEKIGDDDNARRTLADPPFLLPVLFRFFVSFALIQFDIWVHIWEGCMAAASIWTYTRYGSLQVFFSFVLFAVLCALTLFMSLDFEKHSRNMYTLATVTVCVCCCIYTRKIGNINITMGYTQVR